MKVGIIGCGGIAQVHGECYKHMNKASVVAVADIVPERADKLAESLGAEALYSAEELLKRTDIDVVDICLPTYLHCEYTIKAAEAGFHILCEKPIAVTLEEGEQMAEAAKKAGVKLMIAHVLRYFPENIDAKKVIESGAIGIPKVVRTYRGGTHPGRVRDWYEDINKSGGAIQDMAIHDIDFLQSVIGPVKEVYALGNMHKNQKYNEYDVVLLEFNCGTLAHVIADWSKPKGASFATSMEIAGTEGIVEYDSTVSTPIKVLMEKSEQGGGDGVAVPESPLHPESGPYFREIAEFLEAVENDTEPPIKTEAALEALRVALAARKSIETGRPVKLEEEM